MHLTTTKRDSIRKRGSHNYTVNYFYLNINMPRQKKKKKGMKNKADRNSKNITVLYFNFKEGNFFAT